MDKTLCGATAMLLIGGATQSSATKYRKWIVLPCLRREAELIGEVAQRDGGVRCHCSGRPCIRLQPLPGCAVLPLLTTLRSVNRGR